MYYLCALYTADSLPLSRSINSISHISHASDNSLDHTDAYFSRAQKALWAQPPIDHWTKSSYPGTRHQNFLAGIIGQPVHSVVFYHVVASIREFDDIHILERGSFEIRMHM